MSHFVCLLCPKDETTNNNDDQAAAAADERQETKINVGDNER